MPIPDLVITAEMPINTDCI